MSTKSTSKSIKETTTASAQAAKRVRPAAEQAKSMPRAPSGEMLTTLEYRCTETGATSVYEVPGDAKTLKDLWSRTLSVTCPQCRQIHKVSFRDAYIDAVVTSAAPTWVERL